MSEAEGVTRLRTDPMIAAELRGEAQNLLVQLATVMNKARSSGMTLNFAMGYDAFGLARTTEISVVKVL